MTKESFLDYLSDWTEWDVVSYYLARVLGVIDPQKEFLEVKGIFWTANPTN